MLQRNTIFLLSIMMLTTSSMAEPAATPAVKPAAKSASKGPIIGNPDAPVGGTFYRIMDQEPVTVNPLKIQDVYGQEVEGLCFDTLLGRNIETYEFEPSLAEKWSVAPDGKTFTFTIRKDAKFHNGEPVTVADVKFSYEARLDAKLADAAQKVYFENIDHAEILGPYEIKFFVKNKYFMNLDVIAGMSILPKSAYGDATKKMSREVVGSGPYRLEKLDQGKSITFVRNKEWWGFDAPENKGYNKFEKIIFKIIKDQNAQLELLKKGEIDYMGLTPEQFEKKTEGPEWGTKLFKENIENSAARGTAYIAFNLLDPKFNDLKVRKALSMLFNRPFMIQKFLFDKALPAKGPWYQQSPDADPNAKPYTFDPAEAKKLLKEAGWADTDKDGVLDKVINGQKTDFRFTVFCGAGGSDWEKILTVYQEELKKSGIILTIKSVDWNTLEKAMDERKFDAVALAWSGTIQTDPKQIWHSKSNSKGGSNFINYSNPEVDKLIEQAREEMVAKKRIPMLRKVYSLIAQDYPYVFLWNSKYTFYAHDKKVQMVKPTYKFDVGVSTWWQGPE